MYLLSTHRWLSPNPLAWRQTQAWLCPNTACPGTRWVHRKGSKDSWADAGQGKEAHHQPHQGHGAFGRYTACPPEAGQRWERAPREQKAKEMQDRPSNHAPTKGHASNHSFERTASGLLHSVRSPLRRPDAERDLLFHGHQSLLFFHT